MGLNTMPEYWNPVSVDSTTRLPRTDLIVLRTQEPMPSSSWARHAK
jgi:hypothetical protein